VVDIVDAGKGELLDVENGYFAYSHDMVGAALLDFWNYPKTIIDVAHNHHNFEKLQDEDEEVYQLCAIVSLATDFCRIYGIGRVRREEDIDLTANRGAMALEANPIVVDDLLEKFHPKFIKERNLFLS